MSEIKQRGRPLDPLVQAREQLIYSALEIPSTSKSISDSLGLSVPAVRLSLKRLRSKGTVSLHKVDGVFLWSRSVTG
jgi:Mn-dependent DtxR family transcriptional regulator